MMYITKQINQKECGVCVLNTLINMFYHKNIKDTLIQEANITENGLNIYDFEVLGSKHGVHLESFNCSFDELKNEKNKFLVVLVRKNEFNHYTIVRIHNKRIELFDSIDQHYYMNYHDFNKIYANVVIFPQKYKANHNMNILNFHALPITIDLKYFIFCLFAELIVIFGTIIGASYVSRIFDESINKFSLKNALLISYFFIALFTLCYLLEYWKKIKFKLFYKKYYLIISNRLIMCLKKMKVDQLHKIDKNHLYMIDDYLRIICQYYASDYINFFASIILMCMILAYIFIISIQYFIIIILSLLIAFLYTLFSQKFQEKYVKNNFFYSQKNIQTVTNYFNNIIENKNYLVNEKNIDEIKNIFHEKNNIWLNQSIHSSLNSMVINGIKKMQLIVIVVYGVYSYVYNNEMQIAKIILIITLCEIGMNSCIESSNFILRFYIFNCAKDVYKNIASVEHNENNKLEFDEENKINKFEVKYNNKFYKIENGFNVKKFGNLFNCKECLLKKDDNKIFINGIDIAMYKQEEWEKKFWILNATNVLHHENIILKNLKSHPEIIEFIKKFKHRILHHETHIGKNISYHQINNILLLCLQKNKIIYFDNCFKYIRFDCLMYIRTHLIPLIMKNNFVIYDLKNKVNI